MDSKKNPSRILKVTFLKAGYFLSFSIQDQPIKLFQFEADTFYEAAFETINLHFMKLLFLFNIICFLDSLIDVSFGA